MSPGAAAVVALLAVLLVPPGSARASARGRARRLVDRDAVRGRGAARGRGGAARAGAGPEALPSGPRSRVLAALAAGAGSALLLGGAVGAAVGLVVSSVVWVAVGRLEPSGLRHRREALERQAPLVVDLVAACLASGATVQASVRASAYAVGDPAASLLRHAVDTAALGAPAADAWRAVADEEPLAAFARAVVRSLDTGAPLAEVLPRLAARARAVRAARAEARVRTAAVRLTGPLGLAFLPAFVLLGVVPVVAAWVGAVL